MPMDARDSRICRLIIIVVTVAMAGLFAAMANAVLVVSSIAPGAILFYICKRSVAEIEEDERDARVSEQASKVTVAVFASACTLSGLILIALRNEYPEYMYAGFALAFSACALMILYSILYGYYNRRYGYEPSDEE